MPGLRTPLPRSSPRPAVYALAAALAVTVLAPARLAADSAIILAQSAQDPATTRAIRDIIRDQMAAFRRDDAAAAFQDASPFIQGRFQSPGIFLDMVRNGYAPVYRPQQVEFRDLVPAEDGLDQRVFVLGPDGLAYLAHYLMQRQPDGGWKINGCILELLDDRST